MTPIEFEDTQPHRLDAGASSCPEDTIVCGKCRACVPKENWDSHSYDDRAPKEE